MESWTVDLLSMWIKIVLQTLVYQVFFNQISFSLDSTDTNDMWKAQASIFQGMSLEDEEKLIDYRWWN